MVRKSFQQLDCRRGRFSVLQCLTEYQDRLTPYELDRTVHAQSRSLNAGNTLSVFSCYNMLCTA